MIGEVSIKNTTLVKNELNSLLKNVSFYNKMVAELQANKMKISSNWDGDSTDIKTILTKMEGVITTFSNLIPLIKALSNELISLTNELEKTANTTI